VAVAIDDRPAFVRVNSCNASTRSAAGGLGLIDASGVRPSPVARPPSGSFGKEFGAKGGTPPGALIMKVVAGGLSPMRRLQAGPGFCGLDEIEGPIFSSPREHHPILVGQVRARICRRKRL